MVRTRGGLQFRPKVRHSTPADVDAPPPAPPSIETPPLEAAAAVVPSLASAAAAIAVPNPVADDATAGTQAVDPPSHRYNTRVGLVPPSPEHPRPPRRALPSKQARTSSPRESSRSRPMPPQSPPLPGRDVASPQLSPASMIRRPIFHCDPIPENSDYRAKEIHSEFYYDLPALAVDPELRDSMRLVHRYSLEPFTTPRQYFYPRVVLEFYHTMTSRGVANSTAIQFSIDGRPGILRATNIAATFDLPVVLANYTDYRQWPHPSPREMVRLLSRDTSAGSILFRRQLPRACSSSIISCGVTYSRFSTTCRGEEPF